MIKIATACTGIGVAEYVLKRNFEGAHVSFQSEISPKARAIAEKHEPDAVQLGDLAQLDGKPWKGKIDIFVAGTSCQDFSTAGKGDGVKGRKSKVFFDFARVLHEIKPRYFIWENVASVTNQRHQRDFAKMIHLLSTGHVDSDFNNTEVKEIVEKQYFIPQSLLNKYSETKDYILIWGKVEAANYSAQSRSRLFCVGIRNSEVPFFYDPDSFGTDLLTVFGEEIDSEQCEVSVEDCISHDPEPAAELKMSSKAIAGFIKRSEGKIRESQRLGNKNVDRKAILKILRLMMKRGTNRLSCNDPELNDSLASLIAAADAMNTPDRIKAIACFNGTRNITSCTTRRSDGTVKTPTFTVGASLDDTKGGRPFYCILYSFQEEYFLRKLSAEDMERIMGLPPHWTQGMYTANFKKGPQEKALSFADRRGLLGNAIQADAFEAVVKGLIAVIGLLD